MAKYLKLEDGPRMFKLSDDEFEEFMKRFGKNEITQEQFARDCPDFLEEAYTQGGPIPRNILTL